MIRILTASLVGLTGITHYLKIYDVDQTGTDLTTEITLESPGYTLDYNANITDLVQGGIIESSCVFVIRNIDGVLTDLVEGLATSPEGRYLVQIEKGGSVFWRGIILSDFSSREDLSEGGYSFTATDGMLFMDNVFVDTQNPPTGESATEKLLVTIIKGLNQIPTLNLWNTGADAKFLYVKTDWYDGNMTNTEEPLMQVFFKGSDIWRKVEEKTGYNGKILSKVTPMTYREMLQHTMERFNAILVMQEGAWYILQRDMIAEETVTFRTFRATYSTLTGWAAPPFTVEKNMIAACLPYAEVPENRWRAGGNFDHLPALSKLSVIFGGGNLADGYDSIVPNGFVPGTEYTTVPLASGTGNYLHIRIKFTELYTLDYTGTTLPQHDFKANVYYKLTVKQGSYYLLSGGTWTLTPSYVLIPATALRCIQVEGVYTLQEWANVDFDLLTSDLPVDDMEVTIELDYHTITISYGGEYFEVLNPAYFTPDVENHYVMYIVDNDQPVNYVEFEVENETEGFVNEIELTPSLFGTARVIQNTNFSSYDGWGIVPMWGKGYSSTKEAYFNALLIQEMMGQQMKNLLTYSGTIHDRTATPMTVLQGIGIIYEPDIFADMYLLHFNKVTYNAQAESWSGDWFEIWHSEIMPPTPIPHPDPYHFNTDIDLNLELLPLFIDTGTGDIDTTGGGITADPLGGSITTNKMALVQQTTTPTVLPAVGKVLLFTDKNGAIKQIDHYANVKDTGVDSSKIIPNPNVEIVNGFLYNWYVTQEATLISTSGWAVPTEANFQTLIDYLIANGFNYDDTTTGNKIGKALATATGWDVSATTGAVGNTDYTAKRNVTGFSAIPSGYRYGGTGFGDLGISSTIWSKTEDSSTDGNHLLIRYPTITAIIETASKSWGCAIRLFRTATAPEQALGDGTIIDDAYIGNDEKRYQGVVIGTQVWTVQNLAETRYNDGLEIPYCEDGDIWLSSVVPKLCAYDNDIDNVYVNNGELVFKNDELLLANQLKYDDTESLLYQTTVQGAINKLAKFIAPVSTESPSITNSGKIRYRFDDTHSWIEICMQTGTSTWTWVVIKTNTW